MKKKLITLLLFSFFIFSCNNDDIAEHEICDIKPFNKLDKL